MPADDFLPTARLPILRQRAALLEATRAFFRQRGYWEVETPLLSRDCCIDAWLEPFAVPLPDGSTGWLQTSPEFGMKRLLAAGADRIFQITRSFRKDESGPLHNCEFTILEWYAQGEDHFLQMDFVEALVRELRDLPIPEMAEAPANSPLLRSDPFPRLSYEQVFHRSLGLSPHTASLAELQAAVSRIPSLAGQAEAQDRDALCNLLLAECVEPELAREGAVFLHAYPASQSALARVDTGLTATARRFELYLDGVELCNGYHELTDANELRTRMAEQNRRRRLAGLPQLPEESRLLAAMRHGLPDCSGVALGFDRLVMWRLGCPQIRDLIAFPFERA